MSRRAVAVAAIAPSAWSRAGRARRGSGATLLVAALLATGPVCASQPAFVAGSRGGVPTPMFVPAALLRVTSQPEPSGIAWCPALRRYLIVSDDTGRKAQDTAHAPWLLAMDAAGVLDPQPVPIVGIEALDDPEAITEGPDGTFFLTTSHSLNRKGHLPPARRALLHLAVTGRALQVMGRVDLTAARDPKGSSLLSAAGVDPHGRLDIEGLAFRDAALYLGLKSPLTARGEAIVLRLADAVAALRAGRIPPGGLARFALVPLAIVQRGRAVYQGISDIAFMPDGSLLLLGNAPKGMPGDGGGALWWWQGARDVRGQPVLVHQFDGLKPEGITVSADGDHLKIVFDRDRATPLWADVPLP